MNGFDLRDAFTIEKEGSEITALYLGSDLIWPKTNFEEDYFTIVSLANNNDIRFCGPNTGETGNVSIQVSTDKRNWTTYSCSTLSDYPYGTVIATLNKYKKLYIKGNNAAYAVKQGNNVIYSYIMPTQAISVQGNIMSLIYGDNFIGQTTLTAPYTFCSFFGGGNEWSYQDAAVYNIRSAKHLIMPATTLTPYCYAYMFYWKPGLTHAPMNLPATTLAEGCYYNMFGLCEDLTNAQSILPATTLAEKCYYGMFNVCNLTTSPILPAPSVPTEAYKNMFGSNHSLNYITMLATQLGANALENWVVSVAPTGTFVKAPQQNSLPIGDSGIPTGWVPSDAYVIYINYSTNGTVTSNMVAALEGMEVELTITPNAGYQLSSLTVLDSQQHLITVTNNKFTMPSSPVTISAAFVSIPHTITILPASHGTCTANKYSASVGEIITLTPVPDSNYSIDDLYTMSSNGESIITNNQFTMPAYDVTVTCTFANFNEEYLTIESLSDNNTIRWLVTNDGTSSDSIQYSIDKITWNTVSASGTQDIAVIATIDKYEKVYFSNMTLSSDDESIICSGDAKVKGNIMSLIDRSTFTNLVDLSTYNVDGIFRYMFASSIPSGGPYYYTYISDAKDLILPATILSDYCYAFMFYGCYSLVNAPELPATTLTEGCYEGMFGFCLITATPTLPATTLADSCYYNMFSECAGLTTAPELPATILTERCYAAMFWGCSSLTVLPTLPATTLAKNCYNGMFGWCTALTTINISLPVTTLAEGCYERMFISCRSITSAPALPATTLADYCYALMFSGCDSLVNAPALPATTLADYCYYQMFRDCTSLTIAPDLPAPTAAQFCYEEMFANCPLTYIKCMIETPTYISGTTNSFTRNWNYSSAQGTFIKHPNVTWGQSGAPEYSGYPYNFTVISSYLIDVNTSVQHGSVTASPSSAMEGETVTLSFVPGTGYEMPSYYEVYDTTHSQYVSVNNDSFVMPAGNVEVRCTFDAIQYTVDIEPASHGSVSTSASSGYATYGQTITVTTTPNAGYQLSSLTLYNFTTHTRKQINNNQFTMPAANVVVEATFSQANYNVNIASGITGGTVTSNKNTAHYGEVVTLTTTPDSGYGLDTLTVIGATSGSSVTITNNQFVMPAEAVTVNATFIDYSQEPFTIEALEDNVSISINNQNACQLTYTKNGGVSMTLTVSANVTEALDVTLDTGDICTFTSARWIQYGAKGHFIVSGQFKVYGNLMSLNNYSTSVDQQGCEGAFKDNTGLIDATNLVMPATSLGQNAYNSFFSGCTSLVNAPKELPVNGNNTHALMFANCTSLVNPPKLHFTEIYEGGCNQMFRGCTSLVKAPDLNITNVGTWGCYQMFYGCSSLNYLKCTATTKSGGSNFSSWLYRVSSSGTFVKDANSTLWGSGSSGIPSGWTVVNV